MTAWLYATIAITAVSWISWATLFLKGDVFPEKTPIHWNIAMEADGWTSGRNAALSLIVVPILLTLFVAIRAAIGVYSPASVSDEDTRRRFDFVLFLSSAFFLGVMGIVTLAMRSGEFPVQFFMGLMFVFLGAIGLAMRGIKPNPWMGVRTPWTMRDEVVWTRTHDLTAKVWPALAALGLVLVAFDVPPIVYLSLLAPLVIVPIAASYLYARSRRV